jgi:tricarballylate dehydrogenase
MMRPAVGIYDVVVIGGGLAGVTAALAARQQNATVLLLEQAPQALRGGNTRHARNFRLAHDGPAPFIRGTYPAAEFAADLHSSADNAIDRQIVAVLTAQSMTIADWLSRHGVALQRCAGGQIPWSRKTAFFLGGGKTALNALYAKAGKDGIEIAYRSEVIGIRLEGPFRTVFDIACCGQVRRVIGRAAIACSGGYQANKAWLRECWGDAADSFINRGTPYATGTVLRLLRDLGAVLSGDPKACHLVAVDARAPQHDGGIVTRIDGMAGGIVLDGRGRRLTLSDAIDGKAQFAALGRLIADCPGQIAYLLMTKEAARSRRPSHYPAIALADVGASDGIPDQVRQSLFCGPDTVAMPMRPGISFTGYGLQTDTTARIIWSDGSNRGGFFAAGMIMAGTIIRSRYLSGLGATISAVFGRIAGLEASLYARN